MKLWWHPVSLMPWRVRIALAEKGLACDDEIIDLPGGASRTPEFLRLNPFGQAPVLQDGDLVIAESMAILEYIEETTPEPPLMPRAPAARARVRELMNWSTGPWMASWKRWVAPQSIGIPWSETVTRQGRDDLEAHLDVLARALDAGEWLAGDYSLADVCYAPLVIIAGRAGLSDAIEARPAVADWNRRLEGRPAIRQAMGPLLG